MILDKYTEKNDINLFLINTFQNKGYFDIFRKFVKLFEQPLDSSMYYKSINLME